VFVVWEPVLITDWSSPSRAVQSRISDHRTMQFWDKNYLVAKELRQHLSDLPIGSFLLRDSILWDVVAVYPKDANWDSVPPFIDGPVVDVAPEAARQLSLLSGEK
jgi:hypothetical protein